MAAAVVFHTVLKSWGMKLATPLHLVVRLRMCRAVPLLPWYVFILWCLVKCRIYPYAMVLS